MKSYTVSLFGHRKINDLHRIEEKLPCIISEILSEYDSVDFLIGRQGEFDEYAASIIKRLLHGEGEDKGWLTLVLPYEVADIEYYKDYYDDIIIPETAMFAHPKRTATLKNKYMIDASDIVIFYVNRKGGAYRALQYAMSQGKNIINIADLKMQ